MIARVLWRVARGLLNGLYTVIGRFRVLLGDC